MPYYDFGDGKVKVTIEGKVIDEKFANILASVYGLSMYDIILLDKVQKQIIPKFRCVITCFPYQGRSCKALGKSRVSCILSFSISAASA